LPNGPVLGPNLLSRPNGPYTSGSWTPTAGSLTEVTGQTDPFGGTNASLLTDTAVNEFHDTTTSFVAQAGKVLVGAYFLPGTYPNGFLLSDGSTWLVTITSAGIATGTIGPVSNVVVTTVGGYFRIVFNLPSYLAGSLLLRFNTANITYAGTLQNQKFSGLSVQTST
jgi:hypothetical protein